MQKDKKEVKGIQLGRRKENFFADRMIVYGKSQGIIKNPAGTNK